MWVNEGLAPPGWRKELEQAEERDAVVEHQPGDQQQAEANAKHDCRGCVPPDVPRGIDEEPADHAEHQREEPPEGEIKGLKEATCGAHAPEVRRGVGRECDLVHA